MSAIGNSGPKICLCKRVSITLRDTVITLITERFVECVCLLDRERLTGAHVLRFVHVSAVIAVPTTAECGGLDGGATVERTLLT